MAATAPSAAAAPTEECTNTPLGHACTYDAEPDGRPERVYLYPHSARPPVALSLEDRPGYSGAFTGTWAVPDSYVLVALDSHDAGADGTPEWRILRLEAYIPSNRGMQASATLQDANADGTPERVAYWSFSPQRGEESGSFTTYLP